MSVRFDSAEISPQEGPSAVQLEFDDIVYALQNFGGISEYWREMTSRIETFPDFVVTRRSGHKWSRMRIQRSSSRIFHSSYFRTATGPRTRNVTTVHDLAYELGHVGNGLNALLHRTEHKRAYYRSDALICVSQSTRHDLLQVYPDLAGRCPIFVVLHGVTPVLSDGIRPSRPDIEAPYLLFVGGRQAYKNFGNALVAFAESGLVHQGYLLICTGAHFTPAEARHIHRLGLAHAVRSVGKIGRPELAALYTAAHCLVYPSLFEGFGLPILEAMQHGCPVVSSNRSVLPEVAGKAALLVNAQDPTAIAKAILDVGEASTRSRLVAEGRERAAEFTWDRVAAQHASIYRSLS